MLSLISSRSCEAGGSTKIEPSTFGAEICAARRVEALSAPPFLDAMPAEPKAFRPLFHRTAMSHRTATVQP